MGRLRRSNLSIIAFLFSLAFMVCFVRADTPYAPIALYSNQSNATALYGGTNALSATFNSSDVSNVWLSTNESGNWKNYTDGTYSPSFNPPAMSLLGHYENFTDNPTYWNDTDTGTASNCANCDLLLNYSYTQDNYTFTIRYTETPTNHEMTVKYYNASSGAWQLLQTLPVSASNEVGINMTVPENDSLNGKLLMGVHLASSGGGGVGGVYEVSMANTSVPAVNSSMTRTYRVDWQNLSMPINAYVNWTIYLNDSGGHEAVSEYHQFILAQPYIGTCREGDTKSRRLVILNETSPFASVNGSIELFLTTTVGGDTYTYNLSFMNRTAWVCINPASINMTINGLIRVWAPNQTSIEYAGYSVRDYFLLNEPFDNASTDFNLYLIPNEISLQVSLSVQDQYLSTIPDATILVQRWYPDLNAYRTVAAPRTNSNGNTMVNLVGYLVYYRFLIYDSGGVLLQTIPAMLVTGSSITITTSAASTADWLLYAREMTASCSFDNSTDILSCTYAAPSNNLAFTSLVARQEGALTYSVICNRNSTASGGDTLTCDMSSATENNIVWILQTTLTTGTTFILSQGVESLNIATSLLFGNCRNLGNASGCQDGLVFAFLIVLMCALIGFYNPVVSLVLTAFGLVGVTVMGLYVLSIPAVVGLLFTIGILIFRMRD